MMSEPTSQATTENTDPSADDLLVALADERRRRLLRVLRDQDGAPLERLADRVAAREDTERDGDDHRQRLQTRLYHRDLPRLADASLVEFDRDAGRAAPRQWPGLVDAILEHAEP